MRVIVFLSCNECGRKNYTTTKNKEKRINIEIKKYCPKCNKRTIHKETKK